MSSPRKRESINPMYFQNEKLEFGSSDAPEPLDATDEPINPFPKQERPKEENERKKREPLDPGKRNEIHPSDLDKTLQERYPKLREITTQLSLIKLEEFDSHHAEFNSPHVSIMTKLADKAQEAFLLRAVVNAWDKETLFEEFRKEMKKYRDICAMENMPKEMWDSLARGTIDLFSSNNKSIPGLNRQNPHLADRINSRKILQIRAELIDLSKQYVHIENPEWDDALLGDPWMYIASKGLGPETLLAIFDEYAEYVDFCIDMGTNGKCDNWEDLDDMDEHYRKQFREVILLIAMPLFIDHYVNLGVVGDYTLNEIKKKFVEMMNFIFEGKL